VAIEEKSSRQKIAEAEVEGFRKELGPFVVAAETTRMAMVFTDAKKPDHPIIFANDSFLALTGYRREEVLAQSFNFMLAGSNDSNDLANIEAEFRGSEHTPEIRYRRKDGSVFWATVGISPVRDERDNIVQHFASFVDVTWHLQETARLQFLLDELNHRTQNTLATVLAIARQTLRGKAQEDVISSFEGRILALAKVQSLLGSINWDRVSLRDVIELTLEPFRPTAVHAANFSVGGVDVRLLPKDALSLALVVHELATNAVQHGALSVEPAGNIQIDWQIEPKNEGDWLHFHWRESGGPIVIRPETTGFGSRLIEHGLAQDVNGEVDLDYSPSGVVCNIAMPIPQRGGWMNNE